MRELQDAMGVLEFVGNVHYWKRYDATHADMEASSRRKERRKDCEKIQAPCIGNGKSFGEKDVLVGCEEVARFWKRTYYERLILYGMWHKGIASRPRRWASEKSKARRYRRNRR